MIPRFKVLNLCGLTLVVLVLYGCAASLQRSVGQRPPEPAAIRDDLDVDSLRAAIRHSIAYLAKLPRERTVGEQPRGLTAGEILDSLWAFDKLMDQWSCAECFTREIARRFELLPSSTDPQMSEVLFTGYYQPVIDGSLVRTDEYRYPLYGKPEDLLTVEQVALSPEMNVEKIVGRVDGEQFTPYYTRREIDEMGALSGRALEIAWVKDPIDVFFLHIQGSGVIRLPDGRRLSVGYAAQNGRPYRSIGRLLIENGKVVKEEMSMQRLRRYLAENPSERNEIFAYNESYVFFRVIQDGPLGSLEVPVTAGRTIATDSRLFPKGALVFVQTQIPMVDRSGQLAGWRPITRFVLNQDTGGAIRGHQRADLYFGKGDEAGGLAGYMNSRGKMYFVILKDVERKDEGSGAKRGSKEAEGKR
jgi:membrane-bound lytic murein transglycosylase A